MIKWIQHCWQKADSFISILLFRNTALNICDNTCDWIKQTFSEEFTCVQKIGMLTTVVQSFCCYKQNYSYYANIIHY